MLNVLSGGFPTIIPGERWGEMRGRVPITHILSAHTVVLTFSSHCSLKLMKVNSLPWAGVRTLGQNPV